MFYQCNKKKQLIMRLTAYYICHLLSDQESNLDSSDPESDVLPITPSDKVGVGVSVEVVWV
jgi:hypothetical protein